jgi:hypothetical protein
LYLAGPRDALVDVDGPGFVVSARQRATRRYPFVRVSRVVTNRQVRWQTQALQACFDRGIPIVWVNGDGTAVGYLQPALRSPSRLHGLLEEYLARPDWREHFDAWLRSERMRLAHEWRAARQGALMADREWAEVVREYVYGDAECARLAGAEGNICRSALLALAGQYALRCGVRHAYVDSSGRDLDLIEELGTLLERALALELYGLGASARADTAAVLRVFQAFVDRLEDRCVRILGRLCRRVLEILREWH